MKKKKLLKFYIIRKDNKYVKWKKNIKIWQNYMLFISIYFILIIYY